MAYVEKVRSNFAGFFHLARQYHLIPHNHQQKYVEGILLIAFVLRGAKSTGLMI